LYTSKKRPKRRRYKRENSAIEAKSPTWSLPCRGRYHGNQQRSITGMAEKRPVVL